MTDRKVYDHWSQMPNEEFVFDTDNGKFKGIGIYEDFENADTYPSLKSFSDSDWQKRWPNFPKSEMRSRDIDNGDLIISTRLMDALQSYRTETGIPMRIRSGYRSWTHNRSIRGSAKNSMHTYGIAVDIDISNQHIWQLKIHLENHGFKAFGAYPDAGDQFMHADLGPEAMWGDWEPWKNQKNSRFAPESEPVGKQKKKTVRDGLGAIAATAPAVMNGVAGLALPTWLVSGAFVLGLAFVGLILYRNYVK